MAHERNCTVCGKQYNYCPKCLQYSNMEKWHIEYCSAQCKNTFSIINKYAFKHIDKDAAKTLLEGNGITKESNILPRWKGYIDELLTVEEVKAVEKPVAKKAETKTTAKTTKKRTIKRKKDIVNED